jgi:hypothetical protein
MYLQIIPHYITCTHYHTADLRCLEEGAHQEVWFACPSRPPSSLGERVNQHCDMQEGPTTCPTETCSHLLHRWRNVVGTLAPLPQRWVGGSKC